ncbi:MAG: glutathione S-transferase [Proteobacteria bacterium ST_bin15]|nr:MAG: glutathione S-transferase [Proteobacteria bacterium ST_bin15]
MRLFTSARAPNPRRVGIFLAEKGITLPDVVDVDIMKKQHYEADFARLNPFQRIPVLVLDDDTALSESVAICRYIEEAMAPEPNLFGRTPIERAICEMWNRRVELTLLNHTAAVFRHLHPSMAELELPQIPQWGEANKAKVMASCALLDAQLKNSPFIAGDRFSIADITALVAIDFLRPIRLSVPEELTSLRRWHAEVSARPSVAPVK